MMMNETVDLRNLSTQAFAALGAETTFYLKPVEQDGVSVFSIHSALGQPVGTMSSRQEAEAAAFEFDMELVSVH